MKSFEKTKTIRLFHNGNTYEVASGITVQECLETCFGIDTSHLEYKDNPIVAVRADNELLPFSARLKTDVTIELQRLFSVLGKRMYRHTMCYLLALA
ncbi:MAG: nucleoside kinase, partial [Sphaerochaetaceae bacterium]|nr:nucleoside kinase [Sphaerochaetaceae bacterium]